MPMHYKDSRKRRPVAAEACPAQPKDAPPTPPPSPTVSLPSAAPLLALPAEILLEIIRFAAIAPEELAKLALLCKRIAGVVCGLSEFRTLSRPAKRRALLAAKLQTVGLKPRDDSKVCLDYIERGRPALKAVIANLLEMDWFFAHTSYKDDRICTRYSGNGTHRTFMNSEAGKKVAMEKWARRNLGRGYFVASEDVEPVDERPPESLHEKVNGLVAVELRRMVGAMVEKRGVGSLACGEIYRLLDTKFPGIKGSKFSGLAKQLLGDSEVSRILGVFDDSGPCVLG